MDTFLANTHKAVCVVLVGHPYYFVMQPLDEQVLADECSDGIWVVEHFVDERTRVEAEGIKYGLKFEGWEKTYSVWSRDVQNMPLKTAARKRCLAKYKKELEEKNQQPKKVSRQRQIPIKKLPRYSTISDAEEKRCWEKASK